MSRSVIGFIAAISVFCEMLQGEVKEGHSLCPEDLESVIDLKPGVLIIGTGNPGRLAISDDARTWIADKGIKLVALPTKEAFECYNELVTTCTVLAGFHLTCL